MRIFLSFNSKDSALADPGRANSSRAARFAVSPTHHKPYKVADRAISPDLPADGKPDDEPYSNDGQNDRYERTSTPCRTPTYARVGAPAARR
jgi:hypothetical protein